MTVLPEWPAGTVAVLSTGAGAPHAIPVSTAIRRGDTQLAFALALRRESLVRLREDPRCAVVLLAAGLAITVHGRAVVERELERIAVVRVDVESIQDHQSPRFEIDAGVAWHWTSEEAQSGDAETRAAVSQP
ncbi:pyridoxamine 5'-phosphate oxidase family protein [Solirubrobacter phytolaccae]|uniref:Pyridoxamine 5'-phosphate oxidase family protein n=1 Tax=Solirubrobacter phytolaccae TaxID=1404360 RepID=A0A9X3NGF2_9ACTN|nr:pyridoxamine 5'-phosphate oxidase family protein [Solirubrobacter phytolaccae]MDA0184500.1 pyridoxamine 5'-phosphate oxidase family protein [Solirubrobacter phytolaccae]